MTAEWRTRYGQLVWRSEGGREKRAAPAALDGSSAR